MSNKIDITPSKRWYKTALKIISERSENQEDREWATEELKKFDACESDSQILKTKGGE